jgi:hypothetical protein
VPDLRLQDRPAPRWTRPPRPEPEGALQARGTFRARAFQTGLSRTDFVPGTDCGCVRLAAPERTPRIRSSAILRRLTASETLHERRPAGFGD